MIYVNRNIFPIPKIFDSVEIRVSKKRLEEYYYRPKQSRAQEKFSRPFEPELRDAFLIALRELFNGKCAYCESTMLPGTSKSEYDHFRPKNGARGFEKEFSTDHYWWLTYEWNNLYYCCPKCNQYKSTWFPMNGDRCLTNTLYHELILVEKPLLIDPCVDNPEAYLRYNDQGEIYSLSNKGKTTIEIIKLNRSDLVDARLNVLAEIQMQIVDFYTMLPKVEENIQYITQIINEWRDIFSNKSSKPYLALWRQELGNKIRDTELSEYLEKRNFKIFLEAETIEAIPFNFDSNKIKQQKVESESIIENAENLLIEETKHIYVEKIELKKF